jgi:hypothetical protein
MGPLELAANCTLLRQWLPQVTTCVAVHKDKIGDGVVPPEVVRMIMLHFVVDTPNLSRTSL